MNDGNARSAVVPVGALTALALAGVLVWAWLVLTGSRQTLNSLDEIDGMHFDR